MPGCGGVFDPSAEALDLAGQVNAGTLSEADMARALWDWQSQGMDLARLSAALAAFAAGADADGVRNAGDIGNNVAENNALETVWDLASLALSLNELGIAIENGDTLDIILAGGAVVIDGIAVALPGAPGGAGAALSVSRETGDVVLTQVDDAGRAVETTLGNVNDLRTGAGPRNGNNGGVGGSSSVENRIVTDFIDGVTVIDRGTGTTFTGAVDLRPTLDRIDNGIPHPHRNDGSTFRNREGLLPSQPEGYYTEFVHPTPGLNGPGPQRIIRGQGGELYYTPDHYRSFIPLNQ